MIDATRSQGEGTSVGLHELGLKARGLNAPPGVLEHLRLEVETDETAAGSYPPGCLYGVETSPGPNLEDPFAGDEAKGIENAPWPRQEPSARDFERSCQGVGTWVRAQPSPEPGPPCAENRFGHTSQYTGGVRKKSVASPSSRPARVFDRGPLLTDCRRGVGLAARP